GNACAPLAGCVLATCVPCARGGTWCDGACVDTERDSKNCGACGHACAGGTRCDRGACSCPLEWMLCGGDSRQLNFDPDPCGGCHRACAPDQACFLGSCTVSCPRGYARCGRFCVDLQLDGHHCGGCGMPCLPRQLCRGGTCVCPPDTPDLCDGKCVDLASDV